MPTTQINGSINLTDNLATRILKGLAKLNGNVTLTNHSQFTLSNNATQIGQYQTFKSRRMQQWITLL